MNWIALNIPLAVVMFGFTVGLPLWIMLKHPDTDRPVAQDPSVLQVAATGVEGRVAADATSPVEPVSDERRMAHV